MTTSSPRERLIPLTGTVNFRDVGGYSTRDGRVIAWGRLYRADSLNHLSREDHAEIRRLGIATVIDLRSTDEVELGRFPVDELPVSFHHLPLIETVSDPEQFSMVPGLLARSYIDMIDEAGPHIMSAIDVLSVEANQPAIVHCTAGKDRTGVLIALILGLLGVPDDAIIEDYAMSAVSMRKLQERLAERYPDAAEMILSANEML